MSEARAKDFDALLPKLAEEVPDEEWKGPIYVLWVFDPMTDKVSVEHNKGRHRALAVTHSQMAPDVVHPGRLQGYAYKIQGGWRITTEEHRMSDDPHIIKQVKKALAKAFPVKPPPHVG